MPRAPRTIVNGATARVVREATGLTQQTAAAKAGISASYLCDIEAGRRKGNRAIAKALAGVYAITADALITLEMAPVTEPEIPTPEAVRGLSPRSAARRRRAA